MTDINKFELAIGTIPLVILFIDAEPIIRLKRFFGFREEEYDEMSPAMKFIHRMLYCTMCSGFWIGLMTGITYLGYEYQSLMFAGIVSILSEIVYKNFINK